MSTVPSGHGQNLWRRHWPRLTPSAMLTAILPAALTVAGLTTPAPATVTSALRPPAVTALTPDADNGYGNIFIAPSGDTSRYANGPEIITGSGRVAWFHAASQRNAQTTRNSGLFVG